MLICMKSISSNLQYHFIILDGDWGIQRESIFSQKWIIFHVTYFRTSFFRNTNEIFWFYHIAIKQFKIYVDYLSCKVMLNPLHLAHTTSDTTMTDNDYCVGMMTLKGHRIRLQKTLLYSTKQTFRNLYKSYFEYV